MSRHDSRKNAGKNPGSTPAATPDYAEDDHVTALVDQLNAAGPGTRVRVLRKDDRTGRFNWIAEPDAGEFNLSDIGPMFGGGTYRIQIIDGDRSTIRKTAQWEVDRSIVATRRPAAATVTASHSAAVAESPPPASPMAPRDAREFELMLQLERLRMQVENMEHRGRAGDGGLSIKDLLPILMARDITIKDLLPMLTASRGGGASVDELISGLASLDQLRGGRQDPAAAIAGGGEDGGVFAALATALIDKLLTPSTAPQLPNGTTSMQPRVVRREPAAAVGQQPPASAGKPPAERNIDAQTKALKRLVMLVGIAAENPQKADPESYADVAWDALEAGGFTVEQLLTMPTPQIVGTITQHVPALAAQAVLLGEIVEAMKQIHEDAQQAAAQAAGEPGHETQDVVTDETNQPQE